MIIGLTGNIATGKDTVASILQQKGFQHISLSDLLRAELQIRHIPLTRGNLITVANQLRVEKGSDFLARTALAQMQSRKNYVITSIRSIDEAKTFLTKKNFIFVQITAPIELRLQRVQQRNRENDPKTKKELLQREAQENSTDKFSQQLQQVALLTTYELVNDSTLQELERKVDALLKTVGFAVSP